MTERTVIHPDAVALANAVMMHNLLATLMKKGLLDQTEFSALVQNTIDGTAQNEHGPGVKAWLESQFQPTVNGQ